MKRILGVYLLVGALALAGCGANKGAAEMAVKTAQTAFDATKDQAMKIAPEEAKGIQDAIAGAQANLDKGDYKAAMDTAQAIPARVKSMADSLGAKTAVLQGEWDKIKTLPTAVDEFKTKVTKLVAAKRLPAGLDTAKLDAAKTALNDATQAWTVAAAAAQSGDLSTAVARGGDVRKALGDGLTALGMAVPDSLK